MMKRPSKTPKSTKKRTIKDFLPKKDGTIVEWMVEGTKAGVGLKNLRKRRLSPKAWIKSKLPTKTSRVSPKPTKTRRVKKSKPKQIRTITDGMVARAQPDGVLRKPQKKTRVSPKAWIRSKFPTESRRIRKMKTKQHGTIVDMKEAQGLVDKAPLGTGHIRRLGSRIWDKMPAETRYFRNLRVKSFAIPEKNPKKKEPREVQMTNNALGDLVGARSWDVDEAMGVAGRSRQIKRATKKVESRLVREAVVSEELRKFLKKRRYIYVDKKGDLARTDRKRGYRTRMDTLRLLDDAKVLRSGGRRLKPLDGEKSKPDTAKIRDEVKVPRSGRHKLKPLDAEKIRADAE